MVLVIGMPYGPHQRELVQLEAETQAKSKAESTHTRESLQQEK